MPAVVVVNNELSEMLGDRLASLNADSDLKLMRTSVLPTPASEISDFTEANFSGYSSVTLDSDWGAVTFVQDGHYEIETSEHEFENTGGGTDNTVYGFWVESGGELVLAQQFDTPISAGDGDLPFRIKVIYSQKDQSLCP